MNDIRDIVHSLRPALGHIFDLEHQLARAHGRGQTEGSSGRMELMAEGSRSLNRFVTELMNRRP